ncbi:MAG: DUF3179 domain-containing protein [Granulosicoccus sp.]
MRMFYYRLMTAGFFALSGLVSAQTGIQFPQGEFPLTDFDKSSVALEDIQSGGPPKDGIPAIDSPVFVAHESASRWLDDSQPVVALIHSEKARAYPLQILIFHEIVNDVVGGKPVAVTFCPLCNASIVFDREVAGQLLDFGTTGRLRNSDMIMYDRQTESWWQQFTGRGIIGEYVDTQLNQLPSQIVAYGEFKASFPGGEVLSRDTGFSRQYGQNPYRGYDSIDSSPFLYSGDIDPRLPPMERVLSLVLASDEVVGDSEFDSETIDEPANDTAVVTGGKTVGETVTTLIPITPLDNQPVLNLQFGGQSVVVLAATVANSALDASDISKSRKIPVAAAFSAIVGNKQLTFVVKEKGVFDQQTGSEWNAFGHAIAGTLKGQSLRQIDRGVHFAFAWLAFDPGATVYQFEE